MIRHIAFYIEIEGEGKIINITRDIANVIEEKVNNDGSGDAVVIKGVGSDMVFVTLYRFFKRLGVKSPSIGIYTYQLL
ncbi:hypothetical protein [Caviibacterium pharyngocola]|uniref:Uncharacterized protein n=1 Tax=Caviibacterium pharyngocola TaxID=28159 RepID=A0A2M8RV56_9PAST|nr:hypothetical protein [Caviibacterium pharyngocola]PJG82767.1 hypothetical protein CVP04_07330 [Caviibacterium pharyngocola]